MDSPTHETPSIQAHWTWHAALFAGLLWLLWAYSAAAAPARKVVEIVTPGGVKAWLVKEHSIPLVSIKFAFAGGALQDPDGKEGLAGMLASLLTEGAGDFDAEGFARRVADQGAQLAISGARDQVYGGLEALTKRWEVSAELLRLALVSPRFDTDAVERVRKQRLSDLELAENEPRSVAFNRWYAESSPAHPYGRPTNGTPGSVRAITLDDIKAQHRRLLARSSLRLVVVGDVDQAAAVRVLDRIFGGLPAEPTLKPVPTVDLHAIARPVVVEKELPLATAAFGLRSLARDHADYPALQVLGQIIGSGDFDSTLMEEIRVKRGLAYSVSVSLLNDTAASIMLGGMATKNESMGQALSVLRDVLAASAAEGPSQEKFENAKRYLTGSYLLDFDTNAKLAGSLLGIWLEGKSPDFVEKRNAGIARVTIQDVKRVAREVLAWDRVNVIVVGKPSMPR